MWRLLALHRLGGIWGVLSEATLPKRPRQSPLAPGIQARHPGCQTGLGLICFQLCQEAEAACPDSPLPSAQQVWAVSAPGAAERAWPDPDRVSVSPAVAGGWEAQYMCCSAAAGSVGCQVAKQHVQDGRKERLEGFVKTFEKELSGDAHPGIYALDCEMSYTTYGLELTRVTVVDTDVHVVYDTFVKPDNAIVDYNTRFSGVTEADLADTSVTLRDVQAVLLSMFSADTILIGHSLESDLLALKVPCRPGPLASPGGAAAGPTCADLCRCPQVIHSTVVDTSVLFPHRLGLPYKRSLRNLMADYLRQIIQDNGRDRINVCMDFRFRAGLGAWCMCAGRPLSPQLGMIVPANAEQSNETAFTKAGPSTGRPTPHPDLGPGRICSGVPVPAPEPRAAIPQLPVPLRDPGQCPQPCVELGPVHGAGFSPPCPGLGAAHRWPERVKETGSQWAHFTRTTPTPPYSAGSFSSLTKPSPGPALAPSSPSGPGPALAPSSPSGPGPALALLLEALPGSTF
ncbi:hypothetical protein P7K49_032811 [Saguinus oedipus]|uniref:Exonuclease domain-containing protein n=1 Tax=Saguinus oedipus TaxID=9490 RepID=A0ABQ9TQG8_SAGOE|nr:hypothetical protein P7K49_032811 [Saguinus oedipus]